MLKSQRKAHYAVVALVAGVLTSYAVAWSSLLFDLPSDHVFYNTVRSDVLAVSRKGFAAERISIVHASIAESMWGVSHGADPPMFDWSELRTSEIRPRSRGMEEARGWPLKCLVWHSGSDGYRGGIPIGPREVAAFDDRYPDRLVEVVADKVFPFQPLVGRLAFNAVFFGTTWALIVAVYVKVRRILRQRVEHCEECGYSLHGNRSGRCPECGSMISASAMLAARRSAKREAI